MKENKDKPGDLVLKAGECDLIIHADDKGRPVLEPLCPADEKHQPKLSCELKALNEMLRSEEVVLRPAKVKTVEEV